MGFFGRLFGKKDSTGSPAKGAEVVETTDPNEFPKGIKPLSPEQTTMIASWLGATTSFLRELGDSNQADELRAYDGAFAAWLSSGEPESDRDEIISLLGAYLGHRLIADYGMEWVQVKDQYGEELGVRHPSLQIIVFPFDAVIKRINSGETGFLAAIHRAVGDGIAQGGVAKR